MSDEELTVELLCPNCGETQLLPDDERAGESAYSINDCDDCCEDAFGDES